MTNGRTKGFSLVEMMLYVAILTMLLAVIINILMTMNRSVRTLHALRSVQSSGELAMERIVRETRNASAIVTASSTLGADPGTITFSGTDDSGNPRTVEFLLAGGGLHIVENNVDLGSLTLSDATVTSLVFYKISTTHTTAVRTIMAIESGTSTSYRQSNFYTTATLRGTI